MNERSSEDTSRKIREFYPEEDIVYLNNISNELDASDNIESIDIHSDMLLDRLLKADEATRHDILKEYQAEIDRGRIGDSQISPYSEAIRKYQELVSKGLIGEEPDEEEL